MEGAHLGLPTDIRVRLRGEGTERGESFNAAFLVLRIYWFAGEAGTAALTLQPTRSAAPAPSPPHQTHLSTLARSSIAFVRAPSHLTTSALSVALAFSSPPLRV